MLLLSFMRALIRPGASSTFFETMEQDVLDIKLEDCSVVECLRDVLAHLLSH